MSAVISTVSSLLKDVYLPPVVEQLSNEVELLNRIKKKSDAELVGNQVVLPLHTNRTGGIGSRAESEALPTAGNQGFQRAVYDLSYHYGRIQVSGPAMAKTKSNIGSFLDVLKLEMDGIKNDLKKDLARQVWGASDGNAGGNGRIAQCGTTTADNDIVLASDEPLRKGHIYVGMRVDVGTAADPNSLIDGEVVTAVSVAAKTITVSTAVTTSSSNFVSRAGNAGNELNGLQTIIPTAANSVGGIDASVAGNEFWDVHRDNVAGALVIDDMQQMWNTLRVAGTTPDLLLTTPGIQRAYYNLLQDQIRYMEPMKIKAGYDKEALAFNNRPLVEDVDGRFGQIYFLTTDHLINLSNEDWHWLDEDGDVLKWVTGFDAWEAALASYFQVGTDRRNLFGVMYAITDATGV